MHLYRHLVNMQGPDGPNRPQRDLRDTHIYVGWSYLRTNMPAADVGRFDYRDVEQLCLVRLYAPLRMDDVIGNLRSVDVFRIAGGRGLVDIECVGNFAYGELSEWGSWGPLMECKFVDQNAGDHGALIRARVEQVGASPFVAVGQWVHDANHGGWCLKCYVWRRRDVFGGLRNTPLYAVQRVFTNLVEHPFVPEVGHVG